MLWVCLPVFNKGCLQGTLQRLHLLKSQKTRLNILEDISGIIPAGRLCLVLGPPGSGKSTLLQALAGKLQKSDLEVWTVFVHAVGHMGHMCGPNV